MLRRLHLRSYGPHHDLVLDRLPKLSLLVGPDTVGKSAILSAMCLPGYGLRSGAPLHTVPEHRLETVYEFDELARPLRIRVEVTQDWAYATEVSTDAETVSGAVPAWKVILRPRPLPGIPSEARKVAYLASLHAVPSERYVPRWLERWLPPRPLVVEPGLLLVLDQPEAPLRGRGAVQLARFILSESLRGTQIVLTDPSRSLLEALVRGVAAAGPSMSAEVFEFRRTDDGGWDYTRDSLEAYDRTWSALPLPS